jgi:hypothetical protein
MRNQLLLRVLLLLLLGKLLAACVPVGEGEWVPVTPDGSAPAPINPPAPPKVPPIQPAPQPTIRPTVMPIQDPGNELGVRETHAVDSPESCDRMLETFQKQGRNLRLVEKRFIGSNSVLPWLCIFEGSDASSDVFKDNRAR